MILHLALSWSFFLGIFSQSANKATNMYSNLTHDRKVSSGASYTIWKMVSKSCQDRFLVPTPKPGSFKIVKKKIQVAIWGTPNFFFKRATSITIKKFRIFDLFDSETQILHQKGKHNKSCEQLNCQKSQKSQKYGFVHKQRHL